MGEFCQPRELNLNAIIDKDHLERGQWDPYTE